MCTNNNISKINRTQQLSYLHTFISRFSSMNFKFIIKHKEDIIYKKKLIIKVVLYILISYKENYCTNKRKFRRKQLL